MVSDSDQAVPAEDRIYCFAPVADAEARVLILGSMPGAASLQAAQYYAHRHNAFWKIMGALFGAHPELSYPDRLALLRQHGVALWDVLDSCVRPGSLDADIRQVQANDFAGFFQQHGAIRQVFFNGGLAEQTFRRHVSAPPGIGLTRLPSTSPAHASLKLAQKLQAWQVVADAARAD